MTEPDTRLVDGVYEHRLVDRARNILDDPTASPDSRDLAERAVAMCAAVEASLRLEEQQLIEILESAGVAATVEPAPVDRQYHTIRFRVADFAAADAAARALEGEDFVRWEQWSGGAAASFQRSSTQLTVAKTADVTLVVRIAWRSNAARSRVARVLTPTAGDWGMISLPTPLWWGYSIVRPVRLVLERLGLRRRNEVSLGPFLSTPDSLLAPLFDFAGIASGDLVADLGCGDGRIVVRAAEQLGCRGFGVESKPELAQRAVERARDAGVADRVEISCADAREADLTSADVVFMFLPIDVVAVLLESTLAAMRSGAQLIVHEQSRLPVDFPLRPQESRVLLSAGAVTVAHRFTAR